MADQAKSKFAYVANTVLEEQPAPINTRGPIAWLQQNFFSSIRDTVLTLVCAYLVYQALIHLLPWLITHAVWNADSITHCREIDSGACFAVLTNRWHQLVFGFYPSHLYWRPILVFIMMFVAAAPLLHDNLPRKMLWFSALYPLIAYWMLWGGSLWGILLVLGVILLLFGMFRLLSPLVSPPFAGGLTAIFLIVLLLLNEGIEKSFTVPFTDISFLFFVDVGLSFSGISDWFTANIADIGFEPVESAKFGGFLITFVIGVSGIVASFPIGVILALGRGSDMPAVKMLCVGFIEFIRGVPLITLLFVASTLLNYFLPPGTNFDLVLRVIIMVTLFSAAYMAEVVRGGLAALPRGQYEAADALGLNYWQATRLIVLPQALKISIPGIVNTFIGLFKDSTLVSIIGILDPVGIMQPIRSTAEWNGIIWEMPLFIGVVFFICCFTMSRYSMYFERKLDTGHRN